MNDYTSRSLAKMNKKAKPIAKENKAFLKKLQNKKRKDLDAIVHDLHYSEFEKIDCLECANCCKTIGPILFEIDIQRMSDALKMKTSAFKDTYTKIDEDGDFVFSQAPCPFLGSDNYCSIYNSRPKACREYPHTNRKRFYQVLAKTYQNTFVCPAVFNIVCEMKNVMPS